MAGIGFHLRKLATQDNLSGVIRAYFHSAVVAAGPWILVVILIAFIMALTSRALGFIAVDEFLAVVIYNFCFSFMFSAPLYMISARYVADCLYSRKLMPIPGIMITSLGYLLLCLLPLGVLFYVFYAKMSAFATILSIINFALLAQVWIVMLYLSALRDFRAITGSWIVGAILSIMLSVSWGKQYGTSGLLTGFDVGLIFILYAMKAHILTEYPFAFRRPKEFPFYFKNYKKLFWSGFLFFAGLWIDKVIMWAAPEGVTHANHLRTYPVYDGAMFLSYLSIIPVLALFIFGLETNFYDSYIRYIQYIEKNASFDLIDNEKKSIFSKIVANARSFVIFQGSLSFVLILITPVIFEWMGLGFLQLAIFRLGVLGAFFSALNLCIIVIFSYFDSQDNMLLVTGTLFASNALLSIITLKLGFSFYGYGYCLAMILTFLVAGIRLFAFLNQLHYHIFISNIIKKQTLTAIEIS